MRHSTKLLLEKMYEADSLEGADGRLVKIKKATKISIEQGALLYQLAKQPTVKNSLEIGFAYGFSTIYILEGLHGKSGANHIAIDPFEAGKWSGIGIQSIKRMGAENFVWEEQYSIHALSDKIREGKKFDLIFIDGNHRFDDILVDFYLSDQVLNPGGFLILDDMWMDSTNLVAQFISTNRDYKYLKTKAKNAALFVKKGDDQRNWDHFVKFC